MNEEALMGNAGNDGFSKAFTEILSNPEMMSAISSMAQKFKDDNAKKETNAAPESEKEEKDTSQDTTSLAGKFPELLGLLSNKGAGNNNRRSDLLCALKPYLSQNRIDAIDQIIKLSELSNVFKNLS